MRGFRYVLATGEIESIIETAQDADFPMQADADHDVIEHAADSTDYWVDLTDPNAPVVTAKTALGFAWSSLTVVADGETEVSLGDGALPAAFIDVTAPDLGVHVYGHVADSGTAALTFDYPGAYEVTVRTLKHLDYVATITVEAP